MREISASNHPTAYKTCFNFVGLRIILNVFVIGSLTRPITSRHIEYEIRHEWIIL